MRQLHLDDLGAGVAQLRGRFLDLGAHLGGEALGLQELLDQADAHARNVAGALAHGTEEIDVDVL